MRAQTCMISSQNAKTIWTSSAQISSGWIFFSQPRTSCEMNHRLQQADLHFCGQQKHATCMLEVPGYSCMQVCRPCMQVKSNKTAMNETILIRQGAMLEEQNSLPTPWCHVCIWSGGLSQGCPPGRECKLGGGSRTAEVQGLSCLQAAVSFMSYQSLDHTPCVLLNILTCASQHKHSCKLMKYKTATWIPSSSSCQGSREEQKWHFRVLVNPLSKKHELCLNGRTHAAHRHVNSFCTHAHTHIPRPAPILQTRCGDTPNPLWLQLGQWTTSWPFHHQCWPRWPTHAHIKNADHAWDRIMCTCSTFNQPTEELQTLSNKDRVSLQPAHLAESALSCHPRRAPRAL